MAEYVNLNNQMQSDMNTNALKSELHELIENINEQDVLQTLKDISQHHSSMVQEPELTADQLWRIDQSRRQGIEGNIFTNEQADALISKWLKG